MKITIENRWPDVADKAGRHMTFTADTGTWDDNLEDALSAIRGLLIAFGFDARQVSEAMGDNNTDCF